MRGKTGSSKKADSNAADFSYCHKRQKFDRQCAKSDQAPSLHRSGKNTRDVDGKSALSVTGLLALHLGEARIEFYEANLIRRRRARQDATDEAGGRIPCCGRTIFRASGFKREMSSSLGS